MKKQLFGNTGNYSSQLIFGGYCLSNSTEKESKKVLNLILENGINHIDTAENYGNSEQLIGSWMDKYRDDFFVASKTLHEDYDSVKHDLERARRVLNCDTIDLYQLHMLNVKNREIIFGDNGALKALVEAKKKGWINNIGITGHGVSVPSSHIASLKKYNFDSVLLPWNYTMSLDKEYNNKCKELFDICRKNNIAIQTTKSVAKNQWPGNIQTGKQTWYEPLMDQEAINLSMAYLLSQEFFINTVGDINILKKCLIATKEYFSNPYKPSIKDMDNLTKKYNIVPLFSRCSSP